MGGKGTHHQGKVRWIRNLSYCLVVEDVSRFDSLVPFPLDCDDHAVRFGYDNLPVP